MYVGFHVPGGYRRRGHHHRRHHHGHHRGKNGKREGDDGDNRPGGSRYATVYDPCSTGMKVLLFRSYLFMSCQFLSRSNDLPRFLLFLFWFSSLVFFFVLSTSSSSSHLKQLFVSLCSLCLQLPCLPTNSDSTTRPSALYSGRGWSRRSPRLTPSLLRARRARQYWRGGRDGVEGTCEVGITATTNATIYVSYCTPNFACPYIYDHRWIKFEEDVEEGGDRWSKPHVATISLHSLFELRSCILNGTVMLDLEASSLEQICDLVLENMVNAGQLKLDIRDRVKENLLRRHRHQHEKRHDRNHHQDKHRLPNIRSLVDIGRNSSRSMFGSHSKCVSRMTSVSRFLHRFMSNWPYVT